MPLLPRDAQDRTDGQGTDIPSVLPGGRASGHSFPSTPISAIRNLGPASEAAFARAGILSAEQLREMGADTAYARMIAAGERPHFIGYHALVMAIQGRPWTDCRGAEKAALRKSFDAIKVSAAPSAPPAIEAALDDLGVRVPR